jgi:uncharacterized Tic20 family protein
MNATNEPKTPETPPVPPETSAGDAPETPPVLKKDENMWAMFCHLSALIGCVIPFGNVIGPLVIWSLKKDEFPLVADQGKEAINFQLSLTIYLIVSFILIFIGIGFLLLPLVALAGLILVVIAGVKANEGEKYRYPFAFRFIS